MNRLEINPNNEKYYSKEFIQGYKCGTKSQFDADNKVLEQIRAEILNFKEKCNASDYLGCGILDIIDNYTKGDTDV